MANFRDHLHELLESNPEFRAEYESLQPEFEFRKALIHARIDRGLSQAELADRAGLQRSAITRLERDDCAGHY